jgi:hypothetical protein
VFEVAEDAATVQVGEYFGVELPLSFVGQVMYR